MHVGGGRWRMRHGRAMVGVRCGFSMGSEDKGEMAYGGGKAPAER